MFRPRTVFLGAAILVAAGAATVLYLKAERTTLARAAVLNPDGNDLRALLHRLELTPEHFAAAGLGPAHVSDAVADVYAELVDNPTALRNADEQYRQAKELHDQLATLVRQNQATPDQEQQFLQAQNALAAAASHRQQLLDDYFALAADELGLEAQTRLTRFRESAHWGFPAPYRAEERSEADWVTLRKALANERMSQRFGHQPDDQLQAFLNAIRNDPDFTTAQDNSDASINNVRQAWIHSTGG